MDFLLEVLLEFFGEVIWAGIASIFDGKRPTGRSGHLLRLFGFTSVGLLAGWISVELRPTHVLTDATAQLVWLGVAPVLSAALVFLMHLLFFPRQPRGWPMLHAAALSLAFTAWRFFAL